MTKIAVFKIRHCCLCPQNEMRIGKKKQEFWCLLKNRQVSEEAYGDFPDWCPKPEAGALSNPRELKDLEEYLIERT